MLLRYGVHKFENRLHGDVGYTLTTRLVWPSGGLQVERKSKLWKGFIGEAHVHDPLTVHSWAVNNGS
jgi:hypothetical protein